MNGIARLKSLAGHDRLTVAALTGLALGLRLFRIDFRSIWLDEAYSLRLASGSWNEIWRGAAMDIHPPLFHWLLAGWVHLWGSSEWALRSLSAVAGALFIPVVFNLTRDWAGRRAAFWAAGLCACSPYWIELSRMARMPALLALLSALSLWLFWRMLQTGRPAVVLGYGAVTLAAVYTHYFAWLLVLAQGLYLFMGIGKLKLSREIRQSWLLTQAGLLAGYAPWLPTLWEHLNRGGPAWRGQGLAWFEPLHAFYAFWVGTSAWTLANKLWVCGWFAAAGAVTGCALRFRLKRWYESLPPRAWGLGLTALLVPQIAVWVYSLQHLNVADHRYLSLPALMVMVLAASGLAQLPKRAAILVAALMLTAWTVPLANQYFVYGYYDDWRRAAGRIERLAQPGDHVAIYPAWNATPLDYYLQGRWPVHGLPGNYDPITGITEDYFAIDAQSVGQLTTRIKPRGRVWLVLVNPGVTQTVIAAWFASVYHPVQEFQQGAFQISLGEPRP